MAIVCRICRRQYDITLFEFGKTVKCDCGNTIDFPPKVDSLVVRKIKNSMNKINRETQEIIISLLENAEDFYVPVKKIWKELNSQGYKIPNYDDFLGYLKKDKRFEVKEFKEIDFGDEEEMEELGFYSGARVKLRSRKITKEDMQRITLKHAQNVIDNLVKAYQVRPEDLTPDEEDELIELMRRAKNLKEKINEVFKTKGSEREGR